MSRYNRDRCPNPNWEYYVQVAEYIRLRRLLHDFELRLNFEDGLMDIAIYNGDNYCFTAKSKRQRSRHPNCF